MQKILLLAMSILIASCAGTPASVIFNGDTVETYSAAAGCGTLQLDTDCSQMSGATREIKIEGIPLRIAGGENGKIVFVMSMPKFVPDEKALREGSSAVEQYLQSGNIEILSTRVMYGSDMVFGVHYRLSGDGYSLLKDLSSESI